MFDARMYEKVCKFHMKINIVVLVCKFVMLIVI